MYIGVVKIAKQNVESKFESWGKRKKKPSEKGMNG
jgi:hypothetical protein